MKILVLNGPNINLLGLREPEIYGSTSYDELCNLINQHCKIKNIEVEIFQSNIEGELINKIHEAYFNKINGIVINAGGYTHTSVSILDALKATKIKTVDVHISNINQRDDFRKINLIKEACIDSIVGKGIEGYILAIDTLLNRG